MTNDISFLGSGRPVQCNILCRCTQSPRRSCRTAQAVPFPSPLSALQCFLRACTQVAAEQILTPSRTLMSEIAPLPARPSPNHQTNPCFFFLLLLLTSAFSVVFVSGGRSPLTGTSPLQYFFFFFSSHLFFFWKAPSLHLSSAAAGA